MLWCVWFLFDGRRTDRLTYVEKTDLIALNFRMADTSLDDGWSIIYDQFIGVESIYGIGFGIE